MAKDKLHKLKNAMSHVGKAGLCLAELRPFLQHDHPRYGYGVVRNLRQMCNEINRHLILSLDELNRLQIQINDWQGDDDGE